jgi:hypothetical protein
VSSEDQAAAAKQVISTAAAVLKYVFVIKLVPWLGADRATPR